MRIIDAHHHLWDLDRLHYAWLAEPIDHPVGDYAPIRRNYRVADFLRDARDVDLVKSVHLQAECADPLAESAWLQDVADDPASRGFPHAIVAYADLCDPGVEAALARQSAHRNIRGIRYMLNYEPGEPRFCFAARGDLMEDPDWRRGFATLHRFGLSFDLQIWWQQMEDAARLARSFAETTLVLNHTGMPRRADPDYVAGWKRGMAHLAECPNVFCKISGLGMWDRDWTTESIRPFVLHAIDVFGTERCLFASNFPVDKLSGDYTTLWTAYDTLTADFSESERRALFHESAERVYRI